jgi:NO-binding membrane sensor protein with MHYT domain
MSLWTVVIQLAVALLATALSAFVAIKIKFAPDEASIWRGLKATAIRVGSAIFGLGLVALLAFNVLREGPPSRFDVFTIAFQTVSLGLIVVFRLLGRLVKAQREHVHLTERLVQEVVGPKHDSAKAIPE